jgi:hypothetical protein
VPLHKLDDTPDSLERIVGVHEQDGAWRAAAELPQLPAHVTSLKLADPPYQSARVQPSNNIMKKCGTESVRNECDVSQRRAAYASGTSRSSSCSHISA